MRVDERNRGTSTVTKTGDTITGKQQKTVTVTGKYGEKATMSTSVTQRASSVKLQNTANAFIIGSALGNAAKNSEVHGFAEKTGNALREGNYGSAAHNAIMTTGAALDSLLGGLIGDAARGFGKGLGTLPNDSSGLSKIGEQAASNQAQSEKNGDFAGATLNAAIAKAADTAANAAAQSQGATTSGAKLAEASKNKDGSYSQLFLRRIDLKTGSNLNPKPQINGVAYQIDKNNGIYNWQNIESAKKSWLKSNVTIPDGYSSVSVSGVEYTPIRSDKEFEEALKKVSGQSQQQVEKTAQEMQLRGSEVEAILKRMLESQQTNHQELMNQLAKIGDVVQSATTNQEWTAKTATTEPYTPAGSDTPQQTEFSIDKNGNITARTILRSDLKPNSSQALMRTEVIKNPNAQSQNQQSQQNGQQQQGEQGQNQQGQNTNQTEQQQNQTGQQTGQTGQTTATTSQNSQQQNFCQQNPRAAQCAELGEADYEDLEIPENAIDLKLEPMDIFSTDGTCPANPTFSMGALGTFEIPYDYFCNIARLLRPILILGTIIMCGFFAYNAVKEL